jgi:hypothetical protein
MSNEQKTICLILQIVLLAISTTATATSNATPSAPLEFTLYFANRNLDALESEKRWLQTNENLNNSVTIERAQMLWEELKRSESPGGEHQPLIPSYLTPSAILVGSDQLLVIDLPAQALNRLDIGPAWEYWLVEAISKTMTANLSGIKRVKLVSGGSDIFSLAGHLYIMPAH